MLSSRAFKQAKHELFSVQIRNHNKQNKVTLADEFTIPAGVTTNAKPKKYRERINENHEIKMKIDNIDPKGGIEVLQKYLKKTHPQTDFYVLDLVTRTISKSRNTCFWKRKRAAASDATIFSLHLIYINRLKVLDNYSQEEMWNIVGSLPDDKCRIRTEVRQKTCIVCDPHT